VENSEGNNIAVTFSLPKAAAANVITKAESMPPDNPKTALLKPCF
jgi:hypothetical protein